ncbi:MAG: hypothetical protein AAFO69_15685, partial [Bacteroidota bacterium]
MPTTADITKILSSSCNQTIRDRGESLFDEHRVTIHEMDSEGTDFQVKAEVVGSRNYAYEQRIVINDRKLSFHRCT